MSTTVEAKLPAKDSYSYPIWIGYKEEQELSSKLKIIIKGTHKIAVITDDKVKKIHGPKLEKFLDKASLKYQLFSFPSGEKYKNRQTKAKLEDALLKNNFGRDSLIIAFGGGVVTDMAGFVGATYLRGIPFISLPTTLLAAADASIGGKTGINTEAGKNLIGAFHQPQGVFIETSLWETLPISEIRNGLAETIKQAAISDSSFFALLEDNLPPLEDEADYHSWWRKLTPALAQKIATKNCQIKQKVVSQDEREKGQRQILNWGHTIGHALEKITNFSLGHGFCIAVGMCVEAEMGVRLGWLDQKSAIRQQQLLQYVGLPTKLPSKVSIDKIIELTAFDKKSRQEEARYVMMQSIGQMKKFSNDQWTTKIDTAMVREVLNDFTS